MPKQVTLDNTAIPQDFKAGIGAFLPTPIPGLRLEVRTMMDGLFAGLFLTDPTAGKRNKIILDTVLAVGVIDTLLRMLELESVSQFYTEEEITEEEAAGIHARDLLDRIMATGKVGNA
jgi:hypothetical protein